MSTEYSFWHGLCEYCGRNDWKKGNKEKTCKSCGFHTTEFSAFKRYVEKKQSSYLKSKMPAPEIEKVKKPVSVLSIIGVIGLIILAAPFAVIGLCIPFFGGLFIGQLLNHQTKISLCEDEVVSIGIIHFFIVTGIIIYFMGG